MKTQLVKGKSCRFSIFWQFYYQTVKIMKNNILCIFTILTCLLGCDKYDDSEVKSDIKDLKSRVEALEQQCKNMNANLTSLQAIVEAIQKQDGIVSVDGKALDEKYINEKALGNCDIDLPHQVSESHWFLMGDNRDTSIDSRSRAIGDISKEQIEGQIIFRIWPFDQIGSVK